MGLSFTLSFLSLFFLGGPSPLWTNGPSASGQFVDMCSTFPVEPEGCGEPKRRFFYNATSKTCEPFVSRGCTWNLNQFYTIEECQRHCGKIEKPGSCPPSPRVITTECLTSCMHDGSCPDDQKCCSFGCALRCSDPVKDLCKMPPEKGPCHAAVQNWYYDWETQKCKKFSYGGCLGNKNNFRKRKECYLRCKRDGSRRPGGTGVGQPTPPASTKPRPPNVHSTANGRGSSQHNQERMPRG